MRIAVSRAPGAERVVSPLLAGIVASSAVLVAVAVANTVATTRDAVAAASG